MNTFKSFTRTATIHLDDDVLACHIKDMVDAIVPILVAVYVAGLVAGEYIRTSLQWVSEQVSPLVPMGDVSGTQLTEHEQMGGLQ